MTAKEREGQKAELTDEQALRQATGCLEQGELEQAQRWVSQALALEPESALALNLQGLIHFQCGAYAQAQAVFETLAGQHPDEVTLQVNAGLAAYRQQQLEAALEHFRRVIELDPSYSRAFGYLALVHLLRDERRLARAALQEAGLEHLARALLEDLPGEQAGKLAQEVEQRVEGLLLSSQGDDAPPLAYEGFAEISRLTRRNPLCERPAPAPCVVPAAAAAGEGPTLEAQLAESLLVVPPPGAEQALLQRGLLVVRVTERDFASRLGGTLVLQERVMLHGGALGFQQAQRVRKGADSGPFAVEGSPLIRLEGSGYVVCAPQPGRRGVLLTLAGEGLFLRETALLACSSLLHWENGRIPRAGADGPAVMHLCGSGFVALQLAGELLACSVAERQPVVVQLDHLVGWTEGVVPEQLQRSSDALTVGFHGTGMVWLSFARTAEESRGS